MEYIFRIFNPSRKYRTIDYANTPIIENIGKKEWVNLQEVSSFNYTWDDPKKDICDCPFIMGAIPVFSSKAYDRIAKYICPRNAQIIPISIDKKEYFIVNIITFEDDFLNIKKSDIVYFSNHHIMDITNYVFKRNIEIPFWFRLSQYINFTFINSFVADAFGVYLWCFFK